MDYQESVLLIVGMVGPIILAFGAFFSRKRIYANWAKTVYVIASLIGLVWGVLGFVVWPPVHFARHTYVLLVALKDICAGMLIGFLLSVVIARPYEKRVSPGSE